VFPQNSDQDTANADTEEKLKERPERPDGTSSKANKLPESD
jgi:hypothetical protein